MSENKYLKILYKFNPFNSSNLVDQENYILNFLNIWHFVFIFTYQVKILYIYNFTMIVTIK